MSVTHKVTSFPHTIWINIVYETLLLFVNLLEFDQLKKKCFNYQ